MVKVSSFMTITFILVNRGFSQSAPTVMDVSPTMNTDVSSMIATGCGYDAWTGSAHRTITDLVVPGATSSHGLKWVRTYASSTAQMWHYSYTWHYIGPPFSPRGMYFPDGRQAKLSERGTKEQWIHSPLQAQSGTADLYLDDGSKVHFLWEADAEQGQPVVYIYQTDYFEDPYGQRTTLAFEAFHGDTGNERLTDVTDESNRWLHITYDDIVWNLVKRVDASDGQWVEYTYIDNPYSAVPLKLLTHVEYSDGTTADYTYAKRYFVYRDDTGGDQNGGLPKLITARDTRAEGAMQSIYYTYKGLDQAHPANFQGQLFSENYLNPNGTAGVLVSRLDSTATIGAASATIDETRGDGPSRRIIMQKPDGTENDTQLVFSKTDYKNVPETYLYDENYFLRSITDRNGKETTFFNTAKVGMPREIHHPGGTFADNSAFSETFTAYHYTNEDFPYYVDSITDDRHYTTTYHRNSPADPSNPNRIYQIDYPDLHDGIQATEGFVYNTLGQVTRHKLKNGYYEHATYVNGLLTGLWNPTLSPTRVDSDPHYSFSYYGDGSSGDVPQWKDRVRTMTDPRGHRTIYEYDKVFVNGAQGTTPRAGRGLVTKISYPDDKHDGAYPAGTSKSFTYDVYGNKLAETNEEIETTIYTYDDYMRLKSVKLPNTPLIPNQPPRTYDYTTTANLSAYSHTTKAVHFETSPTGIRTANTYDNNFRLLTKTEGDQDAAVAARTYFGYDANGNQIRVTDPRGSSLGDSRYATISDYDSRNRKIRVTTPTPATYPGSEVTEWKYDDAGNATTIKRADNTIESKTYDEVNRVLTDTIPKDASTPIITTFTYFPAGTIESVKDGENRTTNFTYNGFDLKDTMTYPNGQFEVWRYDADRNLRERQTVSTGSQAGPIQLFTYDERERKKSMRWSNVVDSSDFRYDRAGRLILAQNPYSTVTHQYDDAGRLMLDRQSLPTASSTPAPPIVPESVVSRKTHGAAGTFDIPLPLTGDPGIECRSGGSTNDYQIVVTFAEPVTCGAAEITSGTASVSSNTTNAAAQVNINLTGVATAQKIIVKLPAVHAGDYTADLFIPMMVVVGDTNGSGQVNAADITQVSMQSGQPLDYANFRTDVVANGTVNASDVNFVKSRSGTGLPAASPNGITSDVSYEHDPDGRPTRLYVPGTDYDLTRAYDGIGRLQMIYDSGVPNPYYQYYYDKASNVTQRKNWLNGTSIDYGVPDELNRITQLNLNVPTQPMPGLPPTRNWFTREHYIYDQMNRLKSIRREEDSASDLFGYNLAGELISASYGVATVSPPQITQQPQSITVTASEPATFSITATGTLPFAYQWKRGPNPINGATARTYTIEETSMADNGATFSVVVSNAGGSRSSGSATLTVNAPPAVPVITQQPQSITVPAGQTATFSVTAGGTAPLHYQWRRGTANITGATSRTYTTGATSGNDNGAVFSVVVSNTAGNATSSNATLTVAQPPEPVTATMGGHCPGSLFVTLSTATQGATIYYNWAFDGYRPDPPDSSDIQYTGSIEVGNNSRKYIQARSYKAGMGYSENRQFEADNVCNSADGTQERLPPDDPDAIEVTARNVSYHLDRAGNRNGADGVVENSQNYSYGTAATHDLPNNLNQYITAQGTSVLNGSEHELTDYAGVHYAYLNDTRLAAVTSSAGVYQLGYDALGRCVRRTTTNGTATYYIYDGEGNILEYGPNSTFVASSIYGRGVDEIIARNNGIGQNLMQDRNGNTLAVTGGNGALLEYYRYDAFGAPTIRDGNGAVQTLNGQPVSAINNRFLFTGREYSEKFKFYECRARAYNPELGRFMSEDPKGFDAGDYNLYRYCLNDPLDGADPMGLEMEDWDKRRAKRDLDERINRAAKSPKAKRRVEEKFKIARHLHDLNTSLALYGRTPEGMGYEVGQAVVGGLADALGDGRIREGTSDMFIKNNSFDGVGLPSRYSNGVPSNPFVARDKILWANMAANPGESKIAPLLAHEGYHLIDHIGHEGVSWGREVRAYGVEAAFGRALGNPSYHIKTESEVRTEYPWLTEP